MGGVIVTTPPKADAKDVEALAAFGVATVSEAMGRTGLLDVEVDTTGRDERHGGDRTDRSSGRGTAPTWSDDDYAA